MNEMSKTNKFILWCVLVAVISFWLWASVQIWLRGSLFEIQNWTNMTVLAFLFTMELILISIGFMLFGDRRSGLYFGLITGATYLTLFIINNMNLAGVFALVMIFQFAQECVRKESSERYKVNSRISIRKSSTLLVIGFFILISFAAYQSPAIESFKNIEQIPSTGIVFIKTIVSQILGGHLSGVEPGEKEAVFNQVTQEVLKEANTILEPYFEYVPPALAFGLFLVLLGIGWIFVWLSVGLGVAVFWILRKTRFVKIELCDVKSEKIVV